MAPGIVCDGVMGHPGAFEGEKGVFEDVDGNRTSAPVFSREGPRSIHAGQDMHFDGAGRIRPLGSGADSEGNWR